MQCPDCMAIYDRDMNAATNIKKSAIIGQHIIGL
nr:hypothetical protein [Methanolobus halotolerans]